VALQFAALSSRPSRNGRGPKVALAGDDRFLNDYLQVVVLSRLPSRLVSFLTRCAVLDRMSGPVCDAALATTGSADLLEWLSRSNMLVIPLDRRRRWYRLHPLLRELLRAELEREQPELARQLARRAAEWCERSNLRAAAVDYAMLAGDADRAARLVVDVALPTYVAGQLSTLQRWFDWFERHDLAGRHPSVALLGGWLNALAGHPAAAERWTDVAEGRSRDGIEADGVDPIDGPLALVKALLCRDGVEQMQTDAEVALSLAPAGSALQATAQLLLGIAQLLAGDTDPAGQRLADAADIGEELGIDTAMVALAERSILAMSGGDWQEAEVLAERARGVARREWLEQYATSALYAVMARLAIHRGDVPRARSDLAHAEGLVPKLTDALPTSPFRSGSSWPGATCPLPMWPPPGRCWGRSTACSGGDLSSAVSGARPRSYAPSLAPCETAPSARRRSRRRRCGSCGCWEPTIRSGRWGRSCPCRSTP
jgi:LuxR family transcriptional regulator, maltose regulon positive regulatory protein